MENLEKLKKIIQEAVPEIMKLKEGCKIKVGKEKFTIHLVGKNWKLKKRGYFSAQH